MKKPHKANRTYCSALAMATALMMVHAPASAQSFDADGSVVEGGAQIIETFDFTEIIVETPSVVIDWLPNNQQGTGDILFQPFGTTAAFRDDGIITDFAVLNRILPNDPARRIVFDGTVISEIQGFVGGSVYFYSPGGILVGSTAVFDVGNLGLTTAEPVTDGFGNFILGNTVDFQQSLSTSTITIDPGAQIFANQNPGSYVALFAPRIIQRGNIAVDGQAALVAGEAGTITFSPDGLFDIQVDIGTDFVQPIENSGIIGGAASLDGSSRVYMVAIAKNNAATIAIRGGSALGFDIANSAFMDGDTVVLSAGFNVTAGEIEAAEASNGFISITPEDSGFGPGIGFTSSVIGKAASDVNIDVRDTLDFLGDADFSGRQVFATLNTNAAAGTVGNLTVGGNLNLLADHTRPGADVGVAQLRVLNGANANIAGDARLGSIATSDGNNDGRALAATAEILVGGVGSTLTVGGNLAVESSSNLAGTIDGLMAQSSPASMTLEAGGVANVGGVTRIKSEAISGFGADARAVQSSLDITSGGQLTTGELNVISRAVGGDSDGMAPDAGDATAGSSTINATGVGSSFTVLSGNTVGDAGAGELNFLANEAIAGAGVAGAGGNATVGNIELSVNQGATVSLPDNAGNPLAFVNRAIGGDTLVDDATGGNASVGSSIISAFNGNYSLGRIAILNEAIGGSAGPGTMLSDGGLANAGSANVTLTSASGVLALEEIRLQAMGGNASTIGSGAGGSGSVGDIEFFVNGSTISIPTAVAVTSSGLGGTGVGMGGIGSTGRFNFQLTDSNLVIGGDLTSNLDAIGGSGGIGGGGFSGSQVALFRGANLTVNGAMSLNGSSIGGDGQTGNGGDAVPSEIFVALFGNSVIDAAAFNIALNSVGGSVLGNVIANGGNTFNARSTISYDGNFNGDTVQFTGDVNISNTAQGGNAGALGGIGGEGRAGTAEVRQFQPGVIQIDGNASVISSGVGGNAPMGQGGLGASGFTQLFAPVGGRISVGGNFAVDATGTGGSGLNGGNGQISSISVESSGSYAIGGDLTITGQATGGDAVDSDAQGVGGSANAGFLELSSAGNDGVGNPTQIAGNVNINLTGTGGNGSNAIGAVDGGRGGNASQGGVVVGGSGSDGIFDFLGNVNFQTELTGGNGGTGVNGGDGGSAISSSLHLRNAGTAAPGQTTEMGTRLQDFTGRLIATGGDGGAATTGTGGDGGFAGEGIVRIEAIEGILEAGTISLMAEANGGAGGSGTTQGNGGVARGPLQELFVNRANALRTELTATNVSLESVLTGGQGTVDGLEIVGSNAAIIVGGGSSVTIGSLAFIEDGELPDAANAGMLPVLDRQIMVRGSNLTIGDFTVTTSAPLALDLIDDGTAIVANSFNLTAGSIIPGAPAGVPFLLDVANDLAITTTNGDLDVGIGLAAGGDLILNSFGGITTGDVTGGNIFMTLGAGGALSTGALTAPMGTVQIEAQDDLAAPIDVDATSLLLRSLNGNVTANDPLTVSGDFTAEAANSIALDSVNASSVTLNAMMGDIAATGPITASGLVDLQTGGGIGIADVNADAIMANALSGAFTAGNLTTVSDINVEAFDTVTIANITANAFSLKSQTGFINSTGTLQADEDAMFEATAASVVLTNVSGTSITGVTGGDIAISGALTATGAVNLNAGGGITMGDASATTLFGRSTTGGFSSGNITATGGVDVEAAGTVGVGDVAGSDITLNSTDGFVNSTGSLQATGTVDLDAANGSINLVDVSGALVLGNAGVDLVITGTANGTDNVDLEASGGGLVVNNVTGGDANLRSLSNNVVAQGDINVTGAANVIASADVSLNNVSAGSLTANAQGGNLIASGVLDIGAAFTADAAEKVDLSAVNAGTIASRAGTETVIGGQWSAPQITITTSALMLNPMGQLDAGTGGSVNVVSTNDTGLFLGSGSDASFTGLVLGSDLFDSTTAGAVTIASTGTGGMGDTLSIGGLDLSGAAGVGATSFTAGSRLDVVGAVVAPNDVALQGELVTLNAETGSIDLSANGSTLTVNSTVFIAGETNVIDSYSAQSPIEDTQTLINTPAATPVTGGVINAGTLQLNAEEAILIQNTGTAELPAGFVVSDPSGLEIGSTEDTLVILNGQVVAADGTVTSGNDAATAFFTALGTSPLVAAGSQINSCDFAGCDAAAPPVDDDNGELTSSVSASVNGATSATNSATSGTSGTTTTTTDTSSSGNTGSEAGGDSGGDSGSDSSSDSGESESSEEAESSSNAPSVTATGAGSAGGGEITVDNVDDGGGANDFVIEDSSAGADAGGDPGGDAGADGGSEGGADAGSSSSDEGSGDTESASDESDSGSDEGDATEESESSEESESEAEEEEAEEETAEEEEDSEGPATGPINPPPSIIDTNTLEQRGTINDPISGSGNPALLDPEVTIAAIDDAQGGQ